MIATGVVRRIDPSNRFIIPKELRKSLNIKEATLFEFFVEGDLIILKKYEESCIFCGQKCKNMESFKGKSLCIKCIKKIKEESVYE